MDELRKENTSVATRKQYLAALRHYFDGLVTHHAILLNPALSVRGERYQVVEGKTPEITVEGARKLFGVDHAGPFPCTHPRSEAASEGDISKEP